MPIPPRVARLVRAIANIATVAEIKIPIGVDRLARFIAELPAKPEHLYVECFEGRDESAKTAIESALKQRSWTFVMSSCDRGIEGVCFVYSIE